MMKRSRLSTSYFVITGNNVMRAFFITGLMFALTACSNSVGHNFDTATVQNIRPGQTTRAELIAMFGPPDTETPYPNGQQLLMWKYSKARVLDTSAGETLTVQTKNGRVFNYTFSKS
ncbi:hypothetical protein CMR03_11720 [Pantoea allii]|uniref:hypothetical protein n=1 Tax=Pantoea allii TaxID=574096 RepID=UPI000BB400A7|nr:hypothetical protein [Pantoea allii]PBK00061.1 hypothetical protein CMR03_12960 [Pantoea allii]PBK00231.1 hypothetical protein CMR03_11720 [Pantoea allii]